MAREPLNRRALLAGILWMIAVGACAPRGGADEIDAAVRVQRMYAQYKAEDFPEVTDLTATAARGLLDSTAVVILDVREARERKVSVIPGAIDDKEFAAIADTIGDKPVLVYCTIGYRSGKATVKLRKRGVNAYNIAGGILAWAHSGGRVVDPSNGESTRRIHVYGSRWNLLPPGWQGVW